VNPYKFRLCHLKEEVESVEFLATPFSRAWTYVEHFTTSQRGWGWAPSIPGHLWTSRKTSTGTWP